MSSFILFIMVSLFYVKYSFGSVLMQLMIVFLLESRVQHIGINDIFIRLEFTECTSETAGLMPPLVHKRSVGERHSLHVPTAK